jgi:glucose/mannose-6-phosphate isomerase
MPEMSHNEIVALSSDDRAKDLALVFLRDKEEPDYVKRKFEFVKERVECKVLEVWSEGEGKLSRMLHLVHVGDFVSYYLAILNGVDPMPVRIIEEMKDQLGRSLPEGQVRSI